MRTIDADTLKRKVQRLATETWKMQVKASAETILNQFIDYIDHAPTVDAVPVVHGRWQYHINANNEVNTKDAYCSRCGFYVDVTTTFNFNKYLHCPNCGTRMDWKDGNNEKAD